ncbi:MAG TPA: GNAT family N-acetyltransferase [Glaciihabitans sp.]|jgi:ribosomal protein S18 acetylase RimI-like enzyme|nr:GNAT family N-acetyltransferase [Glaciihabitans sp.]
MTFRSVDPLSAPAVDILREYYVDIVGRYWGRAATSAEVDVAIADEPSDDLTDTTGVLLIATIGDEVVGCGGVRFVDETTGELTRIFIRPTHRGAGVATRLMTELEARARSNGLGVLQLSTRSDLVEARRLYARLGYSEVPAFNSDPYAHHWFAKQLDGL